MKKVAKTFSRRLPTPPSIFLWLSASSTLPCLIVSSFFCNVRRKLVPDLFQFPRCKTPVPPIHKPGSDKQNDFIAFLSDYQKARMIGTLNITRFWKFLFEGGCL